MNLLRWALVAPLIVVCTSSLISAQQQTYTANDPRIQKIPISLNGMDPLSSTEQNKLVKGNPDFQYLYGPHRYCFASREQLMKFKDSKEKQSYIPGLSGMCPVSIKQDAQPTWGEPEYSVEFDGQHYWCASEKAKETFQKSPWKFAPVFGGKCAVCYVLEHADVQGTWFFSTMVNGRLYLFPNQETLDSFKRDPEPFIDMDLVREDVVERNQGHDTDGQEPFVSTLDGITYFFANQANLDEFESHPDKYQPLSEGGQR